jgi:hypothetical protein
MSSKASKTASDVVISASALETEAAALGGSSGSKTAASASTADKPSFPALAAQGGAVSTLMHWTAGFICTAVGFEGANFKVILADLSINPFSNIALLFGIAGWPR